jgi:hypothetical protein
MQELAVADHLTLRGDSTPTQGQRAGESLLNLFALVKVVFNEVHDYHHPV